MIQLFPGGGPTARAGGPVASAVAVGSEGHGMHARVRSGCDVRVEIPIRGPVESLNASVAAGIALFAAVRAR